MAHQWNYGQGPPPSAYLPQGMTSQAYQHLIDQMSQASAQQYVAYGAPPGQPQYAQMAYAHPSMVPGYASHPSVQAMYGSPQGIDPQVYSWFTTVDQDQSGKISAKELQQALFNADWKQFNNETVRLMICMFDKDQSGTIDVQEFQQLWKYLQSWRAIFNTYDRGSGKLSQTELQTAYQQMGFNLSPNLVNIMTCKFDSDGQRSLTLGNFVQSCVLLRLLTSAFKQRDPMLSGHVTMQYEDFMTMAVAHMV